MHLVDRAQPRRRAAALRSRTSPRRISAPPGASTTPHSTARAAIERRGSDRDRSFSATTLLRRRRGPGEAGFRGLIPWLGGSYQVGYTGQELSTNSRISTLSPEFRSGFAGDPPGAAAARALLERRAGRSCASAGSASTRSRDKFDSELMDIVQNTEDAYWGLIAAQDSTRVAEKSLETAKALLDQTQAQYEVGVVSRVEVVQAEAGVADREFKLIRAQAIERNAQDALIDLVLGPYLEPESEITVEATDRPDEMTVRAVSAAAATEHAMARRPEIQRRAQADRAPQGRGSRPPATSDCRSSTRSAATARRGWPGASTRTARFARSLLPASRDRRLRRPDANDSLLREGASQQYSIAGHPLDPARQQHRAPSAREGGARSCAAPRPRCCASSSRSSARSDVPRAICVASVQGIEAAERAEAAAAEQLRAERVRLEHGESTPFDVLLREQDLVQAQSPEDPRPERLSQLDHGPRPGPGNHPRAQSNRRRRRRDAAVDCARSGQARDAWHASDPL